ncbi:MAG: PTS lactose/cellobiose transporter subunit IIA [Erysipelotrichaceae bacterium]
MEGLELTCFEIISAVGTARSLYIEAIQEAKNKNYDKAEELMNEGSQTFLTGHHAHAKLIQQEAAGNPTAPTLLLLHAEDQLMSAEGFKIIANEFIDLYKKING